MDTIVVHPTTPEESKFLESLLKRMKFSFEKVSEEIVNVSVAELNSINKGIDEANESKLISSSDVHTKARALCSK
ncbi:hypothetical protein [Chryseobacterium sp. FH1]|uniref:hypothetical protein n=1 Tax=Chryseobacterium sp. FH1 TaxID=1233951 RepID=UPI0004E358CA|nr:hypothetical protein [Chryseobacterium sp. FH1]KFC24475.1 hypothetical protein IO90_04050 [Chryseobacterium sp. FH1]